jgi:hypothetical protein
MVIHGMSKVRSNIGVYIWQNECYVIWVWCLDQYLPHAWSVNYSMQSYLSALYKVIYSNAVLYIWQN